jgi:hypothetical protein
VGTGNDTKEDPMPTTAEQLMHDDMVPALISKALAQHGAASLSVTYQRADYLDNYGLPCEHCSDGAVTTVQAYYTSMETGEEITPDGCAACMVHRIAAEAHPDRRIVFEVARIGRRR